MGQHYTYIYRDESGVAYYVGKGIDDRDRRRHAVPVPPAERVERFYHNSAEEAYARERELIAKYGRRDLGTGTLMNLTDGGAGVRNPCERHRRAIAEGSRIGALANGHIGGHVGGRRTAEIAGHLKRIAGLSLHTRWHIKRGIVKSGCIFCKGEELDAGKRLT